MNNKKIKIELVEDVLPLTPLQEGILFHYIDSDQPELYFEQLSIQLSGEVVVENMEKAWAEVIRQNELLRAVYRYEGVKKPVQIILKCDAIKKIPIYVHNFSEIAPACREERKKQFEKDDRQRGIDITEEPCRLHILKWGSRDYTIILSAHHIILDGWSSAIILKELLQVYESIADGSVYRFEKKAKYKEYLNWARKQQSGEEFWKKYFASYENNALPLMRETENKVFKQQICTVSPELAEKLEDYTEKNRVTKASVIYAVWALLMHYDRSTDDLVVGATTSGRSSEIEGLLNSVGLFINTLPLRVKINEKESPKELIRRIHDSLVEIESHNMDSVNAIKEYGNFSSGEELYDTIVVIENYVIDQYLRKDDSAGKLSITDVGIYEYANFDLCLKVRMLSDMEFVFLYNEDAVSSEMVKNMGSQVCQILASVLEEETVEDIKVLTEKEEESILAECLSGYKEHSLIENRPVPVLFQEIVRMHPERTAVVDSGCRYTYGEIDRRSNILANRLIEAGVRKNDVIGIMVNRDVNMVIGFLGILKAGAAYLPVNRDFPPERIQYMIDDCDVKVLIGKRDDLQQYFPDYKGVKCELKDDWTEGNEANPGIDVAPEDLAYIMYTSGSTGKPKGVLIEHKGIPRLFIDADYISFQSDDRILMTGAVTFDAATFEIWGALLNGIELHLIEKESILDPYLLESYIAENGITIMFLSTALFHQHIMQNDTLFGKLRYLLVGGEAMQHKYAALMKNKCPKTQLCNVYGPTECTTFATCYPVPDEVPEYIPIGKAVRGTQVYVFNHLNKLLPVGAIGELVIGGLGVARGYINAEELTGRHFIRNPYIKDDFLYKTGDLVRLTESGMIEFIGRRDHQVKIRGFRIEIEEIVNEILRCEAVRDVSVIVRSYESGTKYLTAYVVPSEGAELKSDTVKAFLKSNLPSYMIPSYFVIMEKIPLNINGKVDVGSLPLPQIGSDSEYAGKEPENETQRILAQVWSEVLEVSPVYVDQNYYDLGGDSIKAIQICSKLRKMNRRLDVKYLLKYPAIEDVEEFVEICNGGVQEQEEGTVLLTPIQRWFFEEMGREPNHFNQSYIFVQKERYQYFYVEKAVNELIGYHGVLRSFFRDGQQVIMPYEEEKARMYYSIQEYDFCNLTDCNEQIRKISNQMQNEMDIVNGPLLKLGIFHKDEEDILVMIIHHLIVDAISWNILIEDFRRIYESVLAGENVEKPEKTDSYRAWSRYLSEYAESQAAEKERAYWEGVLQRMPDENREDAGVYEESLIQTGILGRATTAMLLQKANKAFHTETKELLMTALVLTDRQWRKAERISVSMEGHGRDCLDAGLDISRTVGWFTCMYPVVFELTQQSDLRESIIAVKDTLRRVPSKGIGYGILRYLSKRGLEGKAAACEYSFNYFGKVQQDSDFQMFASEDNLSGIPVSPKAKRIAGMEINEMIIDGQLEITVNYNKNRVSNAEAEQFVNLYMENLKRIAVYCSDAECEEYTCTDYSAPDLTMENLKFIREKIGDKQIAGQIKDIYALSPMQEGILFHSFMMEGKDVYHNQIRIPLKGRVDTERMEESLNSLINRHAILRTCFVNDMYGVYKQVVLAQRKEKVEQTDLRAYAKEQREEMIESILCEKRNRQVDLEKDDLFELFIFRTGDENYELVIQFHHIILDGWSMNLVLNDLFNIYQSEEGTLPDRVHSYSSYISWLHTKDKERAYDYWRNYLADYENKAVIPKYTQKIGENTETVKHCRIVLEKNLIDELNNVTKKNHITAGSLFETAWGILLQKINHADDVVFGVVSSGRPEELEGADKTVGLFITTLPLRVKREAGMSVLEAVQKVQTEHMTSQNYGYISLNDIQGQSELRNELMDHLFVYENYPIKDTVQNTGKCSFVMEQSTIKAYERTNYEFNVTVLPGEETIVDITYNSHAYADYLIDQIGNSFRRILEQIAQNIQMPVCEIVLAPRNEERYITEEFNNTRNNSVRFGNVVEWFENTVCMNGNHIALIDGERTFTYEELNEKANYVAGLILEKGTERQSFYGVMCSRSLEAVAVILGILKTGAAYIPFDTEWPEDRIEYIIKETGCKLIFTNGEKKYDSIGDTHFYNLSGLESVTAKYENPVQVIDGDSYAYAIYTSGSTGKPKGALISHSNLLNYVMWGCRVYEIGREDTFALMTSLAFDLTVTALYCPLMSGGKVAIYRADKYNDAGLILKVVEDGKVNALKITPAHLTLLKEKQYENFPVKKMVVGGEILYSKDCAWFAEQYDDVSIYNEYGPTETTVGVLMHKYDRNTDCEIEVPIGVPGDNMYCYVVDRDYKLLPRGIAGQIVIAGAGLGAGYYKNAELTDKVFLTGVFEHQKRIYCSGDKGYLSDKNEMVYLNRLDHQVKIHGFRIELKEIEHWIIAYSGVKSASVILRDDGGQEKYICAFICADDTVTREALHGYLSEVLPGYMLPKFCVFLDEMPLTINKKIDVQALKNIEIKGKEKEKDVVRPQNEMQELLVELWTEILRVPQVSITDNFFDLGGDSIKAIQLMARLNNKGYRMDMKDLFHYPTVEQIVPYLRTEEVVAEQEVVTGDVPLTPIQQYFFQTVFTDRHHYNQSVMIYCREGLKEELTEKTFQALCCLHDALRMTFTVEQDGTVVQYNRGIEGKLFDIFSYRIEGDNEKEEICSKVAKIQADINLEQGPLVKIGLFHTNNGTHMLIAIHHLVVDGVSWRILLEDFENIYHQLQTGDTIELPKKTTSFKSWSNKLNQYATDGMSADTINYWESIDSVQGDRIPTDYSVQEIMNSDTKVVRTCLSEEETEHLLKDINQAYKTEINDILMCALGQALKEWTGGGIFKILLEGHGREEIIADVNLSRSVGWFTSLYPVVLDMQPVDGDAYNIRTVKYMLRKIPDNGVSYGVLKYLRQNGSYDKNAFPEVSFNYLGQLDDINRELFVKSCYESEDNRSIRVERRSLLDFSAILMNGKMELRLEYSEAVHKEKTAKELLELYSIKLKALIEHCCGKEEVELTPYDYGNDQISMEELDYLTNLYS